MKLFKNLLQYAIIVILALVYSVNFVLFIFPNSFAPAGIDGICTMIQDVSGISIGYLSLLVNIPLIIAAFLFISRKFAINTALFCIVFSVSSILLKQFDLSQFAYVTTSGTSVVLAPIAAGTIRGILYVIILKLSASSGGFDIIAALIKRKYPYFNLMNTIFFLNLSVAICSYFVYGFKIEPVICSIIYAFTTSTVSNRMRSSNSETVKFEIITNEPDSLCKRISDELNITSTVISAKGGYSGAKRKMVISVMTKQNVPKLEEIMQDFKDTVIFKSIVNNSLAH